MNRSTYTAHDILKQKGESLMNSRRNKIARMEENTATNMTYSLSSSSLISNVIMEQNTSYSTSSTMYMTTENNEKTNETSSAAQFMTDTRTSSEPNHIETNDSEKKAKVLARVFTPDSRFKGWRYSPPNNGHFCYGTLAYTCRLNSQTTILRNACPRCRDDWVGIRNRTFTYRTIHGEEIFILWRYGKEIGMLMIEKYERPVMYYEYMRQDMVNSAHYQRVICPCNDDNCMKDLPFLTLGENHHISCDDAEKQLSCDRGTNQIKLEPQSHYSNKHVILTISRCSGGCLAK